VSAPRSSHRYFNRLSRTRNQLSELRDFFFGERRLRRRGEHAQNFSAPGTCREVRLPSFRFRRRERLLRVGRDDLGVGTFARAVRIHLVERFAHAAGQRFFATPKFRFVSLL
jgi:hypothetical protein